MDRLQEHRNFFANLITSSAGGAAQNPQLAAAFASTPRENFVGPGPWRVFSGGSLVETPNDDPIFLYQDVVVAISPQRKINNGQPSLHALCMATLDIREGEFVVHIGAGTGYYTAILAALTGKTGSVMAFEIEPDLAKRARENLSEWPGVTVRANSGSQAPLPAADVIYVSAAASSPLNIWLDALRVGGRLLFPLSPPPGAGEMAGIGAMLLITRASADQYEARFICGAAFIPCIGAGDDQTAAKLSAAFKRGDLRNVKALHRDSLPDETCWFAGNGWWLSTK